MQPQAAVSLSLPKVIIGYNVIGQFDFDCVKLRNITNYVLIYLPAMLNMPNRFYFYRRKRVLVV